MKGRNINLQKWPWPQKLNFSSWFELELPWPWRGYAAVPRYNPLFLKFLEHFSHVTGVLFLKYFPNLLSYLEK